jgi:Fur family peroxide stress response transcriptional regulator
MRLCETDKFIATCKSIGITVTYQRLIIFEFLQTQVNHPSAEDIYKQIRKIHPTISLATIYNTLVTFAEHNLINRVTQLHDVARYDTNLKMHHHLVCRQCKKIIDSHYPALDRIKISRRHTHGFKVMRHQVQFDGVCSECQKKARIKSNE